MKCTTVHVPARRGLVTSCLHATDILLDRHLHARSRTVDVLPYAVKAYPGAHGRCKGVCLGAACLCWQHVHMLLVVIVEVEVEEQLEPLSLDGWSFPQG